MDLRRIRHFVALAETLNFRRAAEALHMAQPPLSVSIQKLEAELCTKLFTRAPGGVALTATGRAALPEARRLLFRDQQFAEVVKHVAEGTGGTLRIGYVGSTTYGMLQKLIPLYRAEYPGVELVLRELTSTRIVQRVENSELDAGLVRTPLLQGTRASLLALERDEFIAALPCANPLAAAAELKLQDLAGQPFVMYASGESLGLHAAAMLVCQAGGFVPRIAQEAVQIQAVLSLVESGLGVALVPSVMRRFQSPRIAYRRIADLPPSAQTGLALVYHPDMESAAAQRLRQVAAREFASPA